MAGGRCTNEVSADLVVYDRTRRLHRARLGDGVDGALNGLAAAQIVDILGDARPGANRLLVTGAAGAVPTTERGITASVVDTRPDAPRLEELLARAASGELPARVHAVVPLDQAAAAQRAMAKGGVRGRYVLKP